MTLSKIFNFNSRYWRTGDLLRPSTILEAHIVCIDDISKLPRATEGQDREVIFDSDFYYMLNKQYQKVFGYDITVEENIPKTANKNRIKCAIRQLYNKYDTTSQSNLRTWLFENPSTIKARNCRYREKLGFVTIYYNCLSDTFAFVDTQSNKLLEVSVASELGYADIFRYKFVFQKKAARESIQCPNSNQQLNPFQTLCPLTQVPIR